MEDKDIRHLAEQAVETTEFKDKVAFLNDALTPRMVAFITGVDNGYVVREWAMGSVIKREEYHFESMSKKIDCAFFITKLLNSHDSLNVIRSWFIGMNPDLDDNSPAGYIRQGRFKDARSAATAFLYNG